MAMQLKYQDSFFMVSGRTCTVRIYQESATPFTVQGLDFPAGSPPLVIEWQEKSIEEPLCGSIATLRIISPGDRTYLDLYTVTPGSVRMDVLLDGALYWSGCLDPEFYEEPYDSGGGYDVSFTFSDFGILERLKYGGTGLVTVQSIFQNAIAMAGINVSSMDQSLISSYMGETKATLDRLCIHSDNFYDEEGEASSMAEVLAGLLQPLSMKMIQRAGKVWIFDINALANLNNPSSTSFLSGGKLGVEPVYNNARIVFSQYAKSGNLSPELKCEGDFSGHDTFQTANFSDDGDFFTYLIRKHVWSGRIAYTPELGALAFNIYPVSNASGIASIHPQTKFFHIQPLADGEETEGVVNWFYTGGHLASTPDGVRKMQTQSLASDSVLFTTERIYLPPQPSSRTPRGRAITRHLIRIVLPALCDCRYNFYETPDDASKTSAQKQIEKSVIGMTVPVEIRLYDEAGNVVSHYENVDGRQSTATMTMALEDSLGGWYPGDVSTPNRCLLVWRDENGGCPILGWKTNRHYHEGRATTSLTRLPDGQYLPYPNTGGYLEIKVLSRVVINRKSGDGNQILQNIRWMLYKAPEISIVKKDPGLNAIENEDIEYTGELLVAAKEEIQIDTICGSSYGTAPTALGVFFDTSGNAILELTRQGRTTQMEQLLIGTLYSHYGSRHLRLTGNTARHSGPLGIFEDPATPDIKLFILGQTQDIMAEESETTFVEIGPDEYVTEEEE